MDVLSCSIDGCTRPRRSGSAEWCNTHYFRNRRNGSPYRLVMAEKRAAVCREGGCLRGLRNGAWGWCRVHYIRWWRYGDPQAVKPHGAWLGDGVSYRGLHARLARARGKATDQTCVSCQGPAEQWAYDYTDPAPKVSEEGSPYSLDIKRYRPMCRSCHSTLDWTHR